MEDKYRNNIVEFTSLYLNNTLDWNTLTTNNLNDFPTFIYQELFNINISETGYGLDNSTKQMTNNIGDLKIYNKNDSNKINYLKDIKKGDLLFFHTKDLKENSPAPDNRYPGHVGIYIGNLEFIHLSLTQEVITIDKLTDNWLKNLVGSRDIIKNIIP